MGGFEGPETSDTLRFLDVGPLEPVAWSSLAPLRSRSVDSPSSESSNAGRGLIRSGEKYFDFDRSKDRDMVLRGDCLAVVSLSPPSVDMTNAGAERYQPLSGLIGRPDREARVPLLTLL